ncbi:ATP-dependent zinc metalloprotease FtsH [uncultured Desulfobacter sp.]|uniref:ATP-dependent zinc metalloprotease FtsH n=1 Tax=uncultured Desulfobacter sp. TaxID=240139 RepID=UPI002AAC4730|nr:ATP-dependent zinc metalloprotease FtsH [uncultured Desulfobacter sp.]
MEKQHKVSIWYVVMGVWVVLLLQQYIASMFAVEVIPYSRFLELIHENKVSEVAVSVNQIQGKLKTDNGGKEKKFRTIRVDADMSQLLKSSDAVFKGEIQSNFMATVMSWIVPTALFFGVWFYLMRYMGKQQAGFMRLGGNKAKIYVQDELNISFNDVAGVDEARQELVEVVDFLKSPGKFSELGGKLPKGVMLVGPPGTGKTLLAKAVAGESGVPFFFISGAEFVEMFVGLGAARVRELFDQAKLKAPCIIFIDELDALGKARGAGFVGGNDEREQTLNQLLVEMDGFDSTLGVILLAATNRPEILDPALLRPGRFDRQILVDRPDKKGREDILNVHLKKIKVEEPLDVAAIAAMTPGMVGADLANLVNEATLLAVRKSKNAVGLPEFQEAVERVIAGLEKKNRLINPKERRIVAFHELGHALVAMNVPGADPVQKISIIPRGIGALGYTLQVPTEDRFLMSRSELLAKIVTLLGGRAAEQIIFNEVSTGAMNDLARATDIAQSMVKEYGMGETLGNVYYARKRKAQFLDIMPDGAAEYSEQTAQKIDEEVKKIISQQYDRALDILSKQHKTLEQAAEILLKNEKMDAAQIEELMKTAS